MTELTFPPIGGPVRLQTLCRLAGMLYVAIIVTGLLAELGIRARLIDFANPQATAEAIRSAPGLFRLSMGADLVMALCDAGLAILLYLVFSERASGAVRGLALAAMVFRLIQTVLIAANLMTMQAAFLLLGADLSQLALMCLRLHAYGYDLGLVFFGVNGWLMGALVLATPLFGRFLGYGLMLAGTVYLTGSALSLFLPDLSPVFAPAYGITIVVEVAFALCLLLRQEPALRHPDRDLS
nr:DUF4386 domain-containing protein [uncultured Cohaesibacter sp.]